MARLTALATTKGGGTVHVLILGSGAREHALGWALARRGGTRLSFAPGNAGTADLGANLADVDPRDPSSVAEARSNLRADLVVIGPEEPLEHGVANRLRTEGIPVFGPSREAARLETSKAFSKEFMLRHGVPTAQAATFTDFESFRRHVVGSTGALVIKKSGLAAGKGVLVGSGTDEMLAFGRTVLPADTILVEERLEGYELSVFAVTDGERYVLLPPCADHKKAHDGDQGPNTGGMGAVCPVPAADPRMWSRIRAEAVEPTIRGLLAEGLLYPGVLFLGLMVTPAGPKVLEYNVRFGDPETQVLLPALDIDWLGLLAAAASGRMVAERVPADHGASRSCVGVVVASPGYPDTYPRGLPVSFSPVDGERALLFHASTSRGSDGVVRTGGGRCFTAVGWGDDLAEARERAYAAAGAARFDGAWWRRDIGVRFLG